MERAKHASTSGGRRRRFRRRSHGASEPHADSDLPEDSGVSVSTQDEQSLQELHDMLSASSLDELEQILAEAAISAPSFSRRNSRHRPTSLKNVRRAESDAPVEPPGCEAVLELPDKIGKEEFKKEVLRLAHTLGCKGWRKIPLEDWREISVNRISGALTNSVFGVTPPKTEGKESTAV